MSAWQSNSNLDQLKRDKKKKKRKAEMSPLLLPLLLLSLLLTTSLASEGYAAQVEGVKCRVLEKANEQIVSLSASLDTTQTLPSFGSLADDIVSAAVDEFSSLAPPSVGDSAKTSVYDRKLADLEASLDAPLLVLYLRQLGQLRRRALARYEARKAGSSEYEAMSDADDYFVSQAEEMTRSGGSSAWDYEGERSGLRSVLKSLSQSSRAARDAELNAGRQQGTAMQYLQMQQQQLQQMQMQLYGGSSPWNVGFAYRVPDTNINLQGGYQQGRWNAVLSCVPDEYASMLGPNGFVNGVGPGNVGVSVNVNL
mmetsp:Transcript_25119/g.50059  ORF Transcript_25119/g.50059 Transcript_25119/m.50059 type:complete len:310 (+) Transcript_25119:1617-2546(+)